MELRELQALLKEELSEQDEFTWPARFRDRMSEYMTEPERGDFYVPETRAIEPFWIVADERPGEETDGYFIVYSEEADLFGLAGKTPEVEDTVGTLAGLFGSLCDALMNIET